MELMSRILKFTLLMYNRTNVNILKLYINSKFKIKSRTISHEYTLLIYNKTNVNSLKL